MGEKWYPAKEPMQIGDKLVPAVIQHDKDGKEIGEPRMASLFRQTVNDAARRGPKCHGGHCCCCGAELEMYSHESAMGVCDECVADPKINRGRW